MNELLQRYEEVPTESAIAAEMKKVKFPYMPAEQLWGSIIYPCAEVAHNILMRITRPPVINVQQTLCGDCKTPLHSKFHFCPGCGQHVPWRRHESVKSLSEVYRLPKPAKYTA